MVCSERRADSGSKLAGVSSAGHYLSGVPLDLQFGVPPEVAAALL